MFQQLNPFINEIIEKQEAVRFSSRNFKTQDKSCNHNAAELGYFLLPILKHIQQ